MATTLREDLNALKSSVDTFLGSQRTWNNKHDEHSHEVLETLNRNIEKLFELNGKIADGFGKLNCKEHSTRMDLNNLVMDEKIKSVEKRVNWIWVVIGGTLLTAVFKAIYTKYIGG